MLGAPRASSLRSSPAATLDLACGPWEEPVRGGPRDSGDPVKLVPKLAGGDSAIIMPPNSCGNLAPRYRKSYERRWSYRHNWSLGITR